ncbi:hypothetical protein HZS_7422 [Henneguya salminicola]|nr:hypothetical protein HZS_7422 [Henneguya salminicola]
MEKCQHINVIEEDIGGVNQNICCDCGDIINYDIGLTADEKNDFKTEGKKCEDLYIPPIQKAEALKSNDETIKSYYKKRKFKNDVVNVLNKLKIEIVDSNVDKIAETYINFLSFMPRTHCKAAIIMECFIFNSQQSNAIPTIQNICDKLNISKRQITRAKKYFKNFCQNRNMQNNLNFSHTFNKISDNHDTIIFNINDVCKKNKEIPDVTQTAVRLADALNKCGMLSFHDHDVTSRSIVQFVKHVYVNNNNCKIKLDSNETNSIFRNRINKINSIMYVILHELENIHDVSLKFITWILFLEILTFIEKSSSEQLNKIICKRFQRYKKR